MGKKSQLKAVRRKLSKNRPQLEATLRKHHEVLVQTGRLFDEGCVSMALSIRVLVHDTQKSLSLLHQLGLKDKIRFVDTAWHINPRNLLPSHPGLVVMQMTGREVSFAAPLESRPQSAQNPACRFEHWWSTPITRDVHGNSWSRSDFVLEIANKEGGAHVDPLSDEAIPQLENDNTIGWSYSDPMSSTERPIENGPVLPSIRQIAHELEVTIRPLCIVDMTRRPSDNP